MKGSEKLPRILPGPDRVVGADKSSEDHIKLSSAEAHINQRQNIEFERRKTPYEKERNVLGILVQIFYEKNQDTFKSPEEVFHLFTKAMFTGRLLEVARLIEKANDKGFFRRFGKFDVDVFFNKMRELKDAA